MPGAALQFIVLVVGCCAAFFAVPRPRRSAVLIVSGVVFYLLFAPGVLWLVAGLVIVTDVLSRRNTYWIAVVALVLVLAYYKLPRGSMIGGGTAATDVAGVVIPLGLSFLTFELIQYAVDHGRGRIRQRSSIDLAAFAMFFPCRVAGPIKRYADFTQAVAAAELSPDNITRGGLRIAIGLLKKVLLADRLAPIAAGLPAATTPLEAWTGALAYSFQLLFDFSAYSDIAIGISLLMGIRVPENFNWPYLSANIQEFWNRWHMSLSSWVRDYVFLSAGRALFKTRLRSSPGAIAAISYIMTFLVIGGWHGLTPNFLLWGAYHGALMVGFHFSRALIPAGLATSRLYTSRGATWAAVAVTFVLVTVGWVFFRFDPADAVRTLGLMLAGAGSVA